MNKILSFVLILLLGAVYSWSGIILFWALTFTSASISIMNTVFAISPWLLSIITLVYFIWKKKGFVSITGLIVGFATGWFFLILGLGMGGA